MKNKKIVEAQADRLLAKLVETEFTRPGTKPGNPLRRWFPALLKLSKDGAPGWHHYESIVNHLQGDAYSTAFKIWHNMLSVDAQYALDTVADSDRLCQIWGNLIKAETPSYYKNVVSKIGPFEV